MFSLNLSKQSSQDKESKAATPKKNNYARRLSITYPIYRTPEELGGGRQGRNL